MSTPDTTTASTAAEAEPHAPATTPTETMLGSFAGSSVVQLVATTAGQTVITVHAATVTVTDSRVTATDEGFRWSWRVDEIEAITISESEPWTILDTPTSRGFGVAVRPDQVAQFRKALAALPDIARLPEHAVRMHAGVIDPFGQLPAGHGGNPELEALAAQMTGWSGLPTIAIEQYATTEVPVQAKRRRFGRRPAGAEVPQELPKALQPQPLAGLDAREISAWFGDRKVLDRVSLDMRAGEVTALIGPSGCGKSTFLRILNRMHEMIPSASLAGEVMLDGHDIYDASRKLTDARREIGMVFQKPNPFPAMSIYDNVVASLRLTGTKVTSEMKDELVESCLMKAGLWNEVRDRLRQPGGGLSGGQQQRLCIARALAIRPRVLLMDEPCSALDPTSTRRIEETIRELVAEVTIVIVTHNMQQAVRVSDQCAFFLAEQGTPGVIVEHGPTPAMFGWPQDSRTNDYVNGRFG
jgi:phosphate transport system ATP-binding protein